MKESIIDDRRVEVTQNNISHHKNQAKRQQATSNKQQTTTNIRTSNLLTMLTSRIISNLSRVSARFVVVRALGTKPPGSDPLDVIRKECLTRNLCDEHGYRRPGVHWVFSVAVTPDDPSQVRSTTSC
jgi:hypothetical protein